MTGKELPSIPLGRKEADPSKSTLELANEFARDAYNDARKRVKEGPGKLAAQEKIRTTIDALFTPAIHESLTIADALQSPVYLEYLDELDRFLQVKVGFEQCSDGRIVAIALFDPRGASFHRRPQGLYDTRPSSGNRNGMIVLNDSRLAASVSNDILDRTEEGKNPEIVEFPGPHILSTRPTHGCGAAGNKVAAGGVNRGTGMRYGGIKEYFDELGNGFFAHVNKAESMGGKGYVFDLTHDAYSQGFIIGLRNVYNSFEPSLSLRENLTQRAWIPDNLDGDILMTELLDDYLVADIQKHASEMNVANRLDFTDPELIATNDMIIGRIAMKMTADAENRDPEYSWIPSSIRDKKSQNALRTLTYHVVRNCAYRIFGEITPGNHDLLEHPEKIIRVGPIGLDNNRREIAFIQNTPPDQELTDADLNDLSALYAISESVLSSNEEGYFNTKGRIVYVTGLHHEGRYATIRDARRARIETESVILNNAARIRLHPSFKQAVDSGDTTVIAGLYDAKTRKLVKILTS